MKRPWAWGCVVLGLTLLLGACYPAYGNPIKQAVPSQVPQARGASLAGLSLPGPKTCLVHAVDLIGGWVAAGTPEQDPFAFRDAGGRPCHGSFDADVLPLFQQANVWFPGALSCRTCHGPDLNTAYARMDLSSYQGILAGTGRASASEKGEDILGGGNWQDAMLYDHLSQGEMPPNGPEGRDPRGPVVPAGTAD